jgi:hypothetical protein
MLCHRKSHFFLYQKQEAVETIQWNLKVGACAEVRAFGKARNCVGMNLKNGKTCAMNIKNRKMRCRNDEVNDTGKLNILI